MPVHQRFISLSSTRLLPNSNLWVITPLSLFMLALGCIEDVPSPPFEITQVTPEAPSPGAEITISGRGFSATPTSMVFDLLNTSMSRELNVAVSGRPLALSQSSSALSDTQIIATLPLDVRPGERLLVVSREGKQTAPFPIMIAGDAVERPRPTADYAALSDMGVRVDAQTRDDGGSSNLDMTPEPELGPAFTITPDNPNATVVIDAEWRDFQGNIELWVSVIARDPSALNIEGSAQVGWEREPLWGAAAQLKYPTSQLRFEQMALTPGPTLAAYTGDVDGVIYWYHGRLITPTDAERLTLMTLRFTLVNPTDLSPIGLGFTSRHSSLRGVKNQRLSATWGSSQLVFNAPDGSTTTPNEDAGVTP